MNTNDKGTSPVGLPTPPVILLGRTETGETQFSIKVCQGSGSGSNVISRIQAKTLKLTTHNMEENTELRTASG